MSAEPMCDSPLERAALALESIAESLLKISNPSFDTGYPLTKDQQEAADELLKERN